jgi:NAD(P)-dependent dehydrogenase (short-subunit alcohol dehydrogenase family)
MNPLQDYFDRKMAGFKGKVALVCGAGLGGIGAPIAQRLGWAGCHVVVVDLTQEKADLTRDALATDGSNCLALGVDLMDREQTATVIETIRDRFGRIDYVCNVAGGVNKAVQNRAIEESSFEIFDDLFALNCNYTFQICRDAAKLMIERGEGGSILNIGSVSGLRSAAYHATYGAAKAAMMALTRSMATEWGRYGIRANCVAPGSVVTERNVASGVNFWRRAEQWAPLRETVRADDIADAAFFLMSDMADRITGQILAVDSGVTSMSPIGDTAHLGERMVADYWERTRAQAEAVRERTDR